MAYSIIGLVVLNVVDIFRGVMFVKHRRIKPALWLAFLVIFRNYVFSWQQIIRYQNFKIILLTKNLYFDTLQSIQFYKI